MDRRKQAGTSELHRDACGRSEASHRSGRQATARHDAVPVEKEEGRRARAGAGRSQRQVNESDGHQQELDKMTRELRSMGYDLDAADGTIELLAHQAAGVPTEFFRLEDLRISVEKGYSGPAVSHAELTLHVAGRSYSSSAKDRSDERRVG